MLQHAMLGEGKVLSILDMLLCWLGSLRCML